MIGRLPRWVVATAGAAAGLMALVLVTALLTAAVSSSQANRSVNTLTGLLRDEHHGRIDDAAAATAERNQLRSEIRRLLKQNRRQAARDAAIVKYLREHGITIPKIALAPSSDVGGSSPKDATPSGASTAHPGSPGHTGTPTPSPSPTPAGGIDVGVLCDLLNLDPCPLPRRR